MKVHALDALLGLDANEPGARGVQRELPLRHEPQIRAAHLVLALHDLEGALAVGERPGEDLLAIARRQLRRQGVLDLAEGAQADAGVGRDRLLLLHGPDLDWVLSAPPL